MSTSISKSGAEQPAQAQIFETDIKSPSAVPVPDAVKKAKGKPGASWKDGERHVLPKNRLSIVFPGLMLCVFLAALDQVRAHSIPLFLNLLIYLFYVTLDNRSDRLADYRSAAPGRKELQLGWKVGFGTLEGICTRF